LHRLLDEIGRAPEELRVLSERVERKACGATAG
jgi:hypothetical protein